ncbi:MAG: hypothetical protein H6834_15880 [Planctomycetes bacterium]|nr:hypothetical protein [Planctomycetota bacterium]
MSSKGLAALLLSMSLCLPACSILGSDPDPEWVQGAVVVDTQSAFWAGVLAGVRSSGMPIARHDVSTGEVESQWVFAPNAFANDAVMRRESLAQPFRRKAHVKISQADDGRYVVAVRVERERNVDEVDPANEMRADWTRERDDVDKAREILERIRYYRLDAEEE